MSGVGLEAVIARPDNVGRGSRYGWVAAPSAAAGPSRSAAEVWCRCSHCLVCARLSSPLAPFNLLFGKTTQRASPLSPYPVP